MGTIYFLDHIPGHWIGLEIVSCSYHKDRLLNFLNLRRHAKVIGGQGEDSFPLEMMT